MSIHSAPWQVEKAQLSMNYPALLSSHPLFPSHSSKGPAQWIPRARGTMCWEHHAHTLLCSWHLGSFRNPQMSLTSWLSPPASASNALTKRDAQMGTRADEHLQPTLSPFIILFCPYSAALTAFLSSLPRNIDAGYPPRTSFFSTGNHCSSAAFLLWGTANLPNAWL